jgi:hypothetical protein
MHLHCGAYDGSRAAGFKNMFAVIKYVNKEDIHELWLISIVIPAYEQMKK